MCPVYKLLSSNFILDFILSAGNTPVTQGLPHCCIQYIFYSCLDFQECNISSWEVSDCFQTFLMSCLLSTVADFTLSHFDVGKGPRISLKSMTKWRKHCFFFKHYIKKENSMGKEATDFSRNQGTHSKLFCLFVCVSAGSPMLGKNTVTKYIFSSVILQ